MQIGRKPRKDKLPVWRTVAEAYWLTFANFPVLLRMSWPWLLALIPLSAAINWMDWTFRQPEKLPLSLMEWVLGFSHSLILLVAGAVIAVPWHQYILLGTPQSASPEPFSDNRTKTYLQLGFLLLVLAEMYTAAKLLGLYGTPGKLLEGPEVNALMIALALSVKWCLAFPAIAIGRDSQPRMESWRATDGNFWRIMFGGVLSTALAITCIVSLSAVAGNDLTRGADTALRTIFTVIWMFAGMSYVTFLSVAYRHFFEVERAQRDIA